MRKHSRLFSVLLLVMMIALFCACDDSDDSDESNDNAAFISAFSGIGITFSESALSGIDVLLTANDPLDAIYSTLNGSITLTTYNNLVLLMDSSNALSAVSGDTTGTDSVSTYVTTWNKDGHQYQIQLTIGDKNVININFDYS